MIHIPTLTTQDGKTTQTLGGGTNKPNHKTTNLTTTTNITIPHTKIPTKDHTKPHKTLTPNHHIMAKIINIPNLIRTNNFKIN